MKRSEQALIAAAHDVAARKKLAPLYVAGGLTFAPERLLSARIGFTAPASPELVEAACYYGSEVPTVGEVCRYLLGLARDAGLFIEKIAPTDPAAPMTKEQIAAARLFRAKPTGERIEARNPAPEPLSDDMMLLRGKLSAERLKGVPPLSGTETALLNRMGQNLIGDRPNPSLVTLLSAWDPIGETYLDREVLPTKAFLTSMLDDRTPSPFVARLPMSYSGPGKPPLGLIARVILDEGVRRGDW